MRADKALYSILRKSPDFLRRTIVPVEGQGGHLVVCMLSTTDIRLKTTSGGSLLDMERSSATGVRRAAASATGETERSLGQATERW